MQKSKKQLTIYQKKGQVTYIAPLQPPTLASFRIWGDSAGASRIRLALLQKYKKVMRS